MARHLGRGLAVAMASALPHAGHAQLAVIRTSVAAPLDVEPGQLFPTPMFAGDLAWGHGSADEAHRWDATLFGLAQLRTHDGRTALVAQIGHEFTADPYNPGVLNPRGTAWEEDVNLVRRMGAVDLDAGWFFRCRHEVDGVDQEDHRVGQAPSTGAMRVVMTKGVTVGIASREFALTPRWHLRGRASADLFTSREDRRIPDSPSGQNWEHARGRFAAVARVSYTAATWAHPYARVWHSMTAFSDPDRAAAAGAVGSGTRLEGGVRLGTRGAIDLFAVRERFFDDLAHTAPRASRVVAFGVRLASSAFY